MTHTLSPEDTGELHLRQALESDDPTRNLGPYLAGMRLPRRSPVDEDLTRTAEIRIPKTIGVVEPMGPELAAWPPLAAADLNTTEYIPLLAVFGDDRQQPKTWWGRLTYRGRHRGGAR